MTFPDDQVEELKAVFGEISYGEEGGFSYFLIKGLALPDGCQPCQVDALLCPQTKEGYSSRFYFAERINTPSSRNWNANGVLILGRTWHAFSWSVKAPDLRLAQMVGAHLKGLR